MRHCFQRVISIDLWRLWKLFSAWDQSIRCGCETSAAVVVAVVEACDSSRSRDHLVCRLESSSIDLHISLINSSSSALYALASSMSSSAETCNIKEGGGGGNHTILKSVDNHFAGTKIHPLHFGIPPVLRCSILLQTNSPPTAFYALVSSMSSLSHTGSEGVGGEGTPLLLAVVI